MVEHKPTFKMRRSSFQSVDNRDDGICGAGKALAPPDFGRNKDKAVPLKRPSHKPTFQKRRHSFQSSDNSTDGVRGVRKALAPPDFERKRSKASSLKRHNTKDLPCALHTVSFD